MGAWLPLRVTQDPPRNTLIVGDNLQALEVICAAGIRPALILTDPPYNTKHARQGYKDRYADWAEMMRPRLHRMYNCLADDGFLAIHISDHELGNLRCLLDEMMGRKAYVGTLVWERTVGRANTAKHFSRNVEYIVVYGAGKVNSEPHGEKALRAYKNRDGDPRGPWKSRPITTAGTGYTYPIYGPCGQVARPPTGKGWSVRPSTYARYCTEGLIWWGEDGTNTMPTAKTFQCAAEAKGMRPRDLLLGRDHGYSRDGTQHVKSILGVHFGSAKPVQLEQWLIERLCPQGGLVLDPFAGSGTVAEAAARAGSPSLLVQRREENRVKHIGGGYALQIHELTMARLAYVEEAWGAPWAAVELCAD
jgi:adenine-specific DNA-methyltransferase